MTREYLGLQDASEGTIELVRAGFAALLALVVVGLTIQVARGRSLEAASRDAVLAFLLCLSLLYPWYLIPVVALVALRPDRHAVGYVAIATLLGLIYYPLSIWAWFDTDFSTIQVHLFQGALLSGPILGLVLVLAVARYRRGRSTLRQGRARREDWA